jgi:hypothetical protein
MQEPANAHQSFSSETVPTLSRTYPVMEFLVEKLTTMSRLPAFADLKNAIKAGLANLEKWYLTIDKRDAVVIVLGECYN